MGHLDKAINQINQKLRLSDVVSQYIKLYPKGNIIWAKCPFHGNGNERTPSFKLDDASGRYYCFGCHESGNMFTFIEKMERLNFPQAVEYLAEKAGVQIEYDPTGTVKKKKDDSALLYDLYERINKTFVYMLKSSKEGEAALSYLKKRNVSDQMIEKFSLGYAPQSSSWLYQFLSKKGYSDEILQSSGLFSRRKFPWPLFANRLIFPVRDFRGRVIAFSGRDLSFSDTAPKYINSPDTLIYSKKYNLYGLYESITELKKKESSAILCEGNFDVISMHQAGFGSAMASLGTSFTEEQANLIGRYTSSVDLMFDSDSAGQQSTDKAIRILHAKAFDVKVHKLSLGKDASEILEKHGPQALAKDFEQESGGYEYLVQKYLKEYNVRTPRGKSDFLKSLSPFLLSTESSVELDSYIQDLAVRLSVSGDVILADLEKSRKADTVYKEVVDKGNEEMAEFNAASVSPDLYAMLILANRRDLFRIYRMRIAFADLKDPDARVLYTVLENALRDDVNTDELFLSLIADERLRNYVSTSFCLDEFRQSDVAVLDEIVDKIRLRSLEERRSVLTSQIKLLSSDISGEDMAELMEKKKEYDREINMLKSSLFSGKEA